MMSNENIEQLLDEEIKRAVDYFFPPEESIKDAEKRKLANSITDLIWSKIKDGKALIFTWNGVTSLLRKLDVEPYYANEIFNSIHTKIRTAQRNSKEKDSFEYKEQLYELNLAATRYFRNLLRRDIKDCDLPKKLKLVKKTLDETNIYTESFKRNALIELQEEFEKEISFRKEELNHRKQLENIENNNLLEKDVTKKHSDLTLDRATLFLDYLFQVAKIACKNTEKAKVISFLTGYSETKIAQAFSKLENEKFQMAEKSELSEKFSKDIEIVRKYFKIVNLEKAESLIDEDLEVYNV